MRFSFVLIRVNSWLESYKIYLTANGHGLTRINQNNFSAGYIPFSFVLICVNSWLESYKIYLATNGHKFSRINQ